MIPAIPRGIPPAGQPIVRPVMPQPAVQQRIVRQQVVPEESFTVMCFVWNADGLRLCETMSQNRANQARSSLTGYITRRPPCIAPDFFEDIRHIISTRQPNLVVITTEDEAQTGTYFHSDLLPNMLPEINYSSLNRSAFRETPGTIRISIYARDDTIPFINATERNLVVKCQNAAATSLYVNHQIYGRLAFVAVNLSNVTDNTSENYQVRRTSTHASNLLCLVRIYDELVEKQQPDHVFLLGDFNYDIIIPGQSSEAMITSITSDITLNKLRDLQRYDDLRNAMKYYPLFGFKEGVSGEGPLFLPTWKLTRDRSSQCIPTGTRINSDCFSNSIGWHDRVLYLETTTLPHSIHCLQYDRLDIKNMHASNHAGVLSFFEIR